MRLLLMAAVAASIGFGANHTVALAPSVPTLETEIVEHGGGCRKSSPPGQCCHMDRKAGVVHCH